jgi:hypothetical protein
MSFDELRLYQPNLAQHCMAITYHMGRAFNTCGGGARWIRHFFRFRQLGFRHCYLAPKKFCRIGPRIVGKGCVFMFSTHFLLNVTDIGKTGLGTRTIWTTYASRVARWHIFKPKIPIWVNFSGRCWYIVCSFGLFYGYFVYCVAIWHIYFMFIWYIFSCFGMLYSEKSGNPVREHSKIRIDSFVVLIISI